MREEITVTEASEILGTYREKVHRLVKSGRLRPVRLVRFGKKEPMILLSRADVESYRRQRDAAKAS